MTGDTVQNSLHQLRSQEGNLLGWQVMSSNPPVNQHWCQQCAKQPATASRHCNALGEAEGKG